MPQADYPPIADLVPHSGAMSLLRRVLRHDAESTVCEVHVADSHLFCDESGTVPAWIGLEYMAQCVAVHGGLLARARGEAPRLGMLLGTRRLPLEVGHLEPDQVLHVAARCVHVGAEMVSFACELSSADDQRRVAAARVNIYVGDFSSTTVANGVSKP